MPQFNLVQSNKFLELITHSPPMNRCIKRRSIRKSHQSKRVFESDHRSSPNIKMKVLELTQFLIELTGLKSATNRGDLMLNFIRNLIVSGILLFLLVSASAFFLVHITNIAKTTEATYCITASALPLAQYWYCIARKAKLRDVIADLQTIINQRKTLVRKPMT